jgi:protoporphyrin/coproporphyrin ferrochelatase
MDTHHQMYGVQVTQPAVPATLPVDHPRVKIGGIAVLLINLGTPDGTDYWSMRRYLAEFLSDKRVIEWPRALWLPILHGIVLMRRPSKSGAAYRSIWNTERDESPLRTITRAQSEKLGAAFAVQRGAGSLAGVHVDWAMRYGNPSIPSRLEALKSAGYDRILLVPLYPQYSAATTATVHDKSFESLMKMRWQPALRTLPPYYDSAPYIEALAASIREHHAKLGWEPEVVLASYHGIPKSYFDKGDPYHCHCMKTTRLLREALGWDKDRLRTTFQSRFGPEQWLQPYTDKTIEALAKEGVKRIAVMNPGFSADCLETLEEIAVEGEEIFHEAGGEKFSHIGCLNDSQPGITMLEALVRRELQGWL